MKKTTKNGVVSFNEVGFEKMIKERGNGRILIRFYLGCGFEG